MLKSTTFSEEAAKRRGSCAELLGDQTDGDSPKRSEGDSPKQSEGDSPKQTEGDEGKVASAGSQEVQDKLGSIPKLHRQRTRTRTISTSVYQDTEGRCVNEIAIDHFFAEILLLELAVFCVQAACQGDSG